MPAEPLYNIDAASLKAFLQDHGLMVVNAEEFAWASEVRQRAEQRRLMRTKAISWADAIKYKLVPYKSKKGLENMAASGSLKKGADWYTEKNGRRMIMTETIRRRGWWFED